MFALFVWLSLKSNKAKKCDHGRNWSALAADLHQLRSKSSWPVLGRSPGPSALCARKTWGCYDGQYPWRVSFFYPSESLLLNNPLCSSSWCNHSSHSSLHPTENERSLLSREPSWWVVKVRFKAVGRAPILVEAKQLGQIGSDQKFGTLANHLRRQLKLKGSESLVRSPTTLKVDEFLYVNSSFAPGLDETVGNLYQVPTSIRYETNGSVSMFKGS